MTTDIVECLRGRREFYNYDPGRWMMSDKPDRDCQAAADEIERLRRDLASKQAEIDALMLEHCPGEMTPEQIEEWGRHQRPSFVPPDAEVSVVEWPKL